MLHGLESWGGLNLKYKSAVIYCNLKVGILFETGCWPIQERIEWSQLMVFHNVIKSNKSHLASSAIKQQITHHMPNTITSKVRNISKQLQLDCKVKALQNTKKSSFKKLIKKKLTYKIQRRLSEESTSHSKLRFIDKEKCGRKAYLEKCHSSIAYQILKIRLNIENVEHWKVQLQRPAQQFAVWYLQRERGDDRKCITMYPDWGNPSSSRGIERPWRPRKLDQDMHENEKVDESKGGDCRW